MRVTGRTNRVSLYPTWYEFKKELGKRSGHGLLNWDWLEAKPKTPLPWHDSDMNAAFSVLIRLKAQKVSAERKGNKQRPIRLEGPIRR